MRPQVTTMNEPLGRDEEIDRITDAFLKMPQLYRKILAATDSPDRPAAPRVWSTLGLLSEHGPASITEMAERVRYSKQAMTTLVRQLEDDGFLSRKVCAEDQRSFVLSITAAGELALEKKKAQVKGTLQGLLAPLTDEEVSRLVEAFEDIHDLLARTIGEERE
jgi:DNA-binding MarR family transcriptional regulator